MYNSRGMEIVHEVYSDFKYKGYREVQDFMIKNIRELLRLVPFFPVPGARWDHLLAAMISNENADGLKLKYKTQDD